MVIAFGSKTCRSRKDLQIKQSLVAVRYSEAITAKCSRQKPQGLAAKESLVVRQEGDHRKRLTRSEGNS